MTERDEIRFLAFVATIMVVIMLLVLTACPCRVETSDESLSSSETDESSSETDSIKYDVLNIPDAPTGLEEPQT